MKDLFYEDEKTNFTNTYSPEYKHQCAVRQLCKWRSEWGLEKFRKYLLQYQLDPKLLQDFVDQYSKGNRGEHGDWK